MPAIVSSFTHPSWGSLGDRAHTRRQALHLSQAAVAKHLGLTVRDYAALESGFIPPDVNERLGKVKLHLLDEVLNWEPGTSLNMLTAVLEPSREAASIAFTPGDRSEYNRAAWARLGAAVLKARQALKMSKPVLGYAIKSTGKSVLRIENGQIYGDPRTAPPGDYNSERYILKRLPLLEMALEWEAGQARQILDGTIVSPTT
ncbi:XRE family transcriptional regulator [Streptomyces sp. A0642]|uniref:helix-turn-helix domain-containing protein n=1 Tax=Streptomyces sp. A0642 TaxID=2563100 RepID=UPI0010A24DEF|nr:helix-turn-helix transcriptional regulator [Streptomyces sp. A0642]THA72453.1 XRE family transcriptional regulator [Streptomyces sp. A0642]